jgi:chromosomal replication initiation ATPase DnaA
VGGGVAGWLGGTERGRKGERTWGSNAVKGLSQIKMLRESEIVKEFEFGDTKYYFGVFDKENAPVRVEKLIMNIGTSAPVPLLTLANAIAEMGERYPDAIWDKALFLRGEKLCLAIQFDKKQAPTKHRRTLAVRLLAGAVQNTAISVDTIKKFNSHLPTTEIRDFMDALGFSDQQLSQNLATANIRDAKEFCLPGRPELEEFFREHVIDYFHRYAEYKAMGIKPPNGILLYGLPGTGKTHTVKALADFLGWKVYDIDIGSIGSPYIHQTSKLLKGIFEKAASDAPSIVLMEEIDALAGARSGMMHDHKIEEIAQLLRLIETSSNQGILVIATTNRFHSMDEAIVRRGRFDHVLEVGLPKNAEIISALKGMFKDKPLTKTISLEEFADSFLGHPMSDIAWAVNEAARLAVKAGKKKIDKQSIEEAISRLKHSTKGNAR